MSSELDHLHTSDSLKFMMSKDPTLDFLYCTWDNSTTVMQREKQQIFKDALGYACLFTKWDMRHGTYEQVITVHPTC